MLQTSFHIPITKGGVLPNQTPVHASKCCKRHFSLLLAMGEYYPTKIQCMPQNVANVYFRSHWQGGSLTQPKSSAWLQMLQRSFLIPIRKVGILPNQTPVYDYKCCKCPFSFPLARGESYPNKLQCITPNVTNVFSHSRLQGWSLTQPNSSAWLQMFQTSFLIPISKDGVLPNQTPVHDSKCCKHCFHSH